MANAPHSDEDCLPPVAKGLCERPASKIQRTKLEFDVQSFTAHALAYGVAAKIAALISGNSVRVLKSANFETQPAREVCFLKPQTPYPKP